MDDPANLGPHLIAAATLGNVAQVGALLDQGADIEERDGQGASALHRACDNGHREVVALLLSRGANMDAKSNYDSTPIIWASSKGHLEVVKLLHSRGADIHHTNEDGYNAFLEAAWEDHLPVCEFLLRKGVDLLEADTDGWTALSHYGHYIGLEPKTKALRIKTLHAAREAYWRELQAADRSTIESLRSDVARLSGVTQTNASLLFSDAFSDLVFACPGGERIHAHRCIVSASSAHARVLLQGPWAENANERAAVVQMPQSAVAVRALLRFLYTGEADAAAVQTSMSDVLDLASQHEQPALKAACERHAIAELSVPTVVRILVAAHLHELAALKAACVALIKANSFAVTLSKAFARLETTHPLLWRELRAALGLPEEEDDDDDEQQQQQQQQIAPLQQQQIAPPQQQQQQQPQAQPTPQPLPSAPKARAASRAKADPKPEADALTRSRDCSVCGEVFPKGLADLNKHRNNPAVNHLFSLKKTRECSVQCPLCKTWFSCVDHVALHQSQSNCQLLDLPPVAPPQADAPAPIAPSQAPIAPPQAPIAPPQAPIAPSQAPISPSQAPMAAAPARSRKPPGPPVEIPPGFVSKNGKPPSQYFLKKWARERLEREAAAEEEERKARVREQEQQQQEEEEEQEQEEEEEGGDRKRARHDA